MTKRRWSKIFSVGNVMVKDIFDSPVELTEKIDGSQINFGVDETGLWILSKGSIINPDDPPSLFRPAVNSIIDAERKGKLSYGFSYHGEAVCSHRHNTLTYERLPEGFIAIYGVIGPDSVALPYDIMANHATFCGFSVVPLLYKGTIDDASQVTGFIKESYLGGATAEGVVIKNYSQKLEYMGNVYPLTQAKYVTETFKEKHQKNPDWKPAKDHVEGIIQELRTEARWLKAIQHFRDNDIAMDVKQIGPLLGEIVKDTFEEEKDWIKDKLFSAFKKKIAGGITVGFPQFYKEYLLRQSLGEKDNFNG